MTATATYRTYTTVLTTSYTHDISRSQEPWTQGGVHHHQIRQTAKGWRKRVIQSNGGRSFTGPSESITEAEAGRLIEAGRTQR